MKNTINKSTTDNTKNPARLEKFAARLKLKFRFRQTLSFFIINTLIFVPLLTVDSSMLKVFAQGFCTGADRIIQGCALGGGQTETDLTNQAIDDVIDFYNLPPNDRSRVLRHGRNEIRSMLYPRIIELIKKESHTPDEQIALDEFASRIKQKRVLAAQKAQEEYIRWTTQACHNYQPPSPYTYNPGASCYSRLSSYFSGPKVPTFEEFQQFGAAIAYRDLYTPEAQDISIQTSQNIIVGAGAGAALVGGVVGVFIGANITFGTLASTILPFATSAVGSGVAPAATAASGAVGATAVAGPAVIIIAAITIAIVQGISVVNASELPGKLDQALIDAQNQTINLRELTTTDAGNQELYGAFLLATLPAFPDLSVPAPDPSDRQFEVRRENGETMISPTINYIDWNGAPRTVRMSGAWFVDRGNILLEVQRLSIRFLDWNNQKKVASRNGGQFIITDPADLHSSQLVEEIPFQNLAREKFTAKIKFEQMTVFSKRVVPVGCNTLVQNPDPGKNVVIGTVGAAGDVPANLIVTVNDAATATVNGITVRNLSVTNDYNIQANVTFPNAATPTDADFTLKVGNSIGQIQSTVFTIRKTAVVDTFLPSLPTNVNVRESYSAPIESPLIVLSCANYTYSVTGGDLPLGTSLQTDGLGQTRIAGTLLSGGKYKFEVSKNYSNGESVKRLYTIFVKSDLADLPDGLNSWWQAEKNAEDFTGRADGTFVGNVKFDEGKVNTGWKFDGTNAYVALPPETFSPSNDFTLELWFKTATRGVILGRQNNVEPYDTPQFGATPAIYVDQNGKLRVQMFQNPNNQFTTSQNRVDDNAYHHVAVTYRRTTNTRTVYLDGAEIGSLNFGQSASGFNKYQFGTGYVSDGFIGGMTGWFNFNGNIDEPTLYDHALSQSEIEEIFTAGGAGKILIDVFVTSPLQRDGNTGSITITALGGSPGLSYSIDGGTTFQNTGSFVELLPGTYPVVVKDGTDRRVTRTAIITNPPPGLGLTTSQVSPPCSGSQSGEIKIFASGETGELEYSVLNGANHQSSNVFSGLNAGTFTPWIRDINSNTIFVGDTIVLTEPAPVVLSPAAFPNAQVGAAYSQDFTVSGGTSPYNLSVNGTNAQNGFALPDGLSATVNGNIINISGTPTIGGTFQIRFATTDQNTCFQSYTFPLTIIAEGTVSIGGRVMNGGQGLPNATVNLSGASNQTATTDASGNYIFNNLTANQNYTVSVALAGYTFAQTSIFLETVNANQLNTDFSTAFIHYEGDIAPRSAGDGSVNILDFISLRRIRLNLDPRPANGGEWQRASVAPRSQLGSTVLLQQDETQLMNYILGVHPLTLAGGPAQANQSNFGKTTTEDNLLTLDNSRASKDPANNYLKVSALAPAQISAASVTASNGAVTVPLTLTSDGNTTAVQFTVNYDASKLTLTSVTTLNQDNAVNANTSTPGVIKVAAYRVLGGMIGFPPNIELMKLNFTVVEGVSGDTPIDFTDSPTVRLAADPLANPIILNSSAGTVTILGPTAANVSISGRVLVGSQGLKNAQVILTNQNGQTRTAATGTFGYYRFENIPAGESYTITIGSKRYQFAPRILFVSEDIIDFNFFAEPS